MAIMKKHAFIQVDFQSSVRLSASEKHKIANWLKMASGVIEILIKNHKIIHSSWLKDTSCIKVSVLLCGEAKIKQLNSEYRNKNKVTDVLSFPSFNSLRRAKEKGDFTTEELYLGDLAICHSRTKQQARDFKISYWDEFIHLFMHGIIHLLGYDHELSQKEEKVMQNFENLSLDMFSKAKKKGPV